MGQDVSNVGLRSHAREGFPVGRLELWHHHGNHGIDDFKVVTESEAEDLIDAADLGMAELDAAMQATAPGFWAFPALPPAEIDNARISTRKALQALAFLL